MGRLGHQPRFGSRAVPLHDDPATGNFPPSRVSHLSPLSNSVAGAGLETYRLRSLRAGLISGRECSREATTTTTAAMDQRRPPEYILEVFADPTCVKDVVKGMRDLLSLVHVCACAEGVCQTSGELEKHIQYFSKSTLLHGYGYGALTGTLQHAGILHTIFFHRYFPSIRPKSRDLLDVTLPVVDEVELETLIDQRTAALIRQIDMTSNRHSNSRGQIAVQFFEKKRRKAWFSKTEEEVCWEQWTLDVTLATPRTESGQSVDTRIWIPVLCYSVPYHVYHACPKRTRRLRSDLDLHTDRSKVRSAMEHMLQRTVLKIVTTANRELDHIPPITTSESNPFPYQIIINPRDEGWRMGIF